MAVRVLTVNPYHPTLSLLMPAITQRITDFARQHAPECDPLDITRPLLAALHAQDPTVLVLALVDEHATVIGHAVALLQGGQQRRWVSITQYRADGNVGDAGLEALETIYRWGESNGAQHALLTTTSDDKRWEKRGYEPVRIIRIRPLGSGRSAQPILPSA